jgi:hypothetical protein
MTHRLVGGVGITVPRAAVVLDPGGDGVQLSGNDQTTDSSGISFQAWRGVNAVFTQVATDAPGSIWVTKYGGEGLDHTDKIGHGIAEDHSTATWVHDGVQDRVIQSFADAFGAL